MCTNPSWWTPTSTKAPHAATFVTTPSRTMPGAEQAGRSAPGSRARQRCPGPSGFCSRLSRRTACAMLVSRSRSSWRTARRWPRTGSGRSEDGVGAIALVDIERAAAGRGSPGFAAEMPYKLPRIEPGGVAADTECDSGDYEEAFDRCPGEFGWEGIHRKEAG